jgi:hypothetical protein
VRSGMSHELLVVTVRSLARHAGLPAPMHGARRAG